MTSPRTSTESANTETNSASTSTTCSWSTPWEKSSLVCAGSARGPELEPSLRSATPTASPTPADSPPTPDSRPSTGNQAPSNTTRKSRGGNHRLKNAMFQAAFVAAQHDPNARAYYQQKRAEGKRHNAAVICVARKRCDIILAMLKTQTPYQPTQHQPLPQAA